MAKRTKREAAPKRTPKLPGRPSTFRGKNREKPIQIYMTDRGLRALEAGQSKRGESRPEYIERLILADNPHVA